MKENITLRIAPEIIKKLREIKAKERYPIIVVFEEAVKDYLKIKFRGKYKL